MFESEVAARVTSGRAETVQVVACGGGGTVVTQDDGLESTVAVESHNQVRVQGLVVGFIVSGLEEVAGEGVAAGPTTGGDAAGWRAGLRGSRTAVATIEHVTAPPATAHGRKKSSLDGAFMTRTTANGLEASMVGIKKKR
jgi:hypothetical protein